MKRRFVVGAAVVVALVGIGYGVHAWLYSLAHVTTDDAYVEGSVTILSAKIPGYVVDLLIDDNRPVKGGDLLLRIEIRNIAPRASAGTLRHMPLQPVGRAAGRICQINRIEVGNAVQISQIIRPLEILRIEGIAAGKIRQGLGRRPA